MIMVLKVKLNPRVGLVDATASGNGTIVRRLRRFENIANDLNVHIRTALSQHCLVGRDESFGTELFLIESQCIRFGVLIDKMELDGNRYLLQLPLVFKSYRLKALLQNCE